ncbi:uncharacterized protein SEPMUDRAFT_66465 [Sphaerulina musiva SO2202]|uniref:Mpv17_PMP22-domain-containing protein n=1 Tax=Sphaerulina musiva (strain SO2202) TaxID=692275 RepID=M3D426_SPHMS|nr:uncharacterized protein SEPMUDRAFT_66465 [Sphaerulina musiva SO2202]EMF12935.1 hypothetical protein SEPMUDRAFT_66465 [Sphaerulina musiva SO2202]
MTFAFFAGRSTLRRLHQTVQRNLHKQHQRNESTKSKHSSKTNPGGGGGGGDVPHTTPPSSGSYYAWLEPIKFPFRAYSSMQARSPLTVQLESSLIIYFLGDLSAQFVQTSSFTEGRYEPIRGLRAMVIGGISSIPSYKWFMWLGRNFNYDKHWKGLVVKIVVSQTLFTPIFNTYFFGMQTLLAGGTWKETVDRVCRTVPVSWVNSWKLWPFVTAFSFTFIPPQNRNIFAGFIAIGWQTYLSWLNRAAEAELRAQEKIEGSLGKQRDRKSSKQQKIEQR